MRREKSVWAPVGQDVCDVCSYGLCGLWWARGYVVIRSLERLVSAIIVFRNQPDDSLTAFVAFPRRFQSLRSFPALPRI